MKSRITHTNIGAQGPVSVRATTLEAVIAEAQAEAARINAAKARLKIGLAGQGHPDWYEGIIFDAAREMIDALEQGETT